MGTTAQKLTYLNDTKGLIKQSINNLGGNITSQTTFRNYATQLENIYQNLPKVNGTGTSLSLSPTIKGRLSSTPKGDTYQYTTTGKNLLPLNNIQETTTNEDTTNDWLVRGLGNLLLISIGVISYLVVKLNIKNY